MDPPAHAKDIDTTWVFKTKTKPDKTLDKYKSHLVA